MAQKWLKWPIPKKDPTEGRWAPQRGHKGAKGVTPPSGKTGRKRDKQDISCQQEPPEEERQ
jgi:hypothetical protein